MKSKIITILLLTAIIFSCSKNSKKISAYNNVTCSFNCKWGSGTNSEFKVDKCYLIVNIVDNDTLSAIKTALSIDYHLYDVNNIKIEAIRQCNEQPNLHRLVLNYSNLKYNNIVLSKLTKKYKIKGSFKHIDNEYYPPKLKCENYNDLICTINNNMLNIHDGFNNEIFRCKIHSNYIFDSQMDNESDRLFSPYWSGSFKYLEIREKLNGVLNGDILILNASNSSAKYILLKIALNKIYSIDDYDSFKNIEISYYKGEILYIYNLYISDEYKMFLNSF